MRSASRRFDARDLTDPRQKQPVCFELEFEHMDHCCLFTLQLNALPELRLVRRKGGRTLTRDWKALYGWAARRGARASRAELVREALSWLGAQGRRAPGRKQRQAEARRVLARVGFTRSMSIAANDLNYSTNQKSRGR